MKGKMNYKKAGVDISAGEKAVELIKPLAKSTFSKNVVMDIGSFGALFKLDLSKWKQPIFGIKHRLASAQKCRLQI